MEGDDGIPGGVKKEAAIVKAEDGTFDLEHEGAVDVSDGEPAFGQGHQLLGDSQIHGVRRAVLGAYHGHRSRQRRISCRRRQRDRRRIRHTDYGIRTENSRN